MHICRELLPLWNSTHLINNRLMEIKTIRKKKAVTSCKIKCKTFPSWEEVQQKRDARNSRYGFDPATGYGTLSVEQLAEMIREAEEGPFYTLEEGKQMIQQWREQRQNR